MKDLIITLLALIAFLAIYLIAVPYIITGLFSIWGIALPFIKVVKTTILLEILYLLFKGGK